MAQPISMSKKLPRAETPEICPVCGEDVPSRALACPECGADHNSGWRAGADTDDALGWDADEFDHDQFVRNEFGKSVKPPGIKVLWWVTALLLVVMALLYLFARSSIN